MESDMKRDAVRDCLDSYAKALRGKKAQAVIINDTDMDFYPDVSTHFSGIPFDYVRTVFEDPYGLALGMLAAQKELKTKFAIILVSQHHSVYHMTPFTLNDLFRAGGDVHLLLFESHMARRISEEGMPVIRDELIESVLPESQRLDFDFMHSFIWVSEKFEAEYVAMGSAAYGEDLKAKAFNAMSTCNNSIIVVHSPSAKEDDSLEYLQKAVECGIVRLYEQSCSGMFKVNYVPSFIPVTEFFSSNKFFSGISAEQIAHMQQKVYAWWESRAPGKMPHPQFIEKEVWSVDFGVSAGKERSSGEAKLAAMKEKFSDTGAALKQPGKQAGEGKFGFSEIEEKDIDTLHPIPSSEIAAERGVQTAKDAPGSGGGRVGMFATPPAISTAQSRAEPPAVTPQAQDEKGGDVPGPVSPSQIRMYTGEIPPEAKKEEPGEPFAPSAATARKEKPQFGLESMIEKGEEGLQGSEIESILAPDESRKLVEDKLHEKAEEAKKKEGWPYYQGEDKPPAALSGMIDEVEEEKKPKEQGRQGSQPYSQSAGQSQQPGNPSKKKPHSDNPALDGMLEEV